MSLFDLPTTKKQQKTKLIRPAENLESSLAVVENINSRWSDENNFKPEDVHRLSQDLCILRCKKCEQLSARKAKDIYKKPDRCGVCAGKIIIQGFNDALTSYPELADVWDYEKNELGPESYGKSSGSKVFIKCNICKQSQLRQISNTVNNITGCAVCSGKTVVTGVNDLASKNPELAKKFSKRNGVNPNEVYYGGRSSYWWDCDTCGLDDFIQLGWKINGSGCGYCSNQKVKEGFNDLTTKRPEILEYWDYKKNSEIGLTPETVAPKSNKKAYFTCEKGHTKFIAISTKYDNANNRVRICSDCVRDHQSYGESELFNFLAKDLGLNVISSDRSILDGSEIDCYLPEFKIGFEFNGDYWHSTKIISEKYGLTAEEYHKNKQSKAAKKGIQLFFVWASDWYADPEVLQKAIRELLKKVKISESKVSGGLFGNEENNSTSFIENVSELLTILSKDSEENTGTVGLFEVSALGGKPQKQAKVEEKPLYVKLSEDDEFMRKLKELCKDRSIKRHEAIKSLKISSGTFARVLEYSNLKWADLRE